MTAAAAGLPDEPYVLALTRAWVDRAVIGLNLCPFAKAPQSKGAIRYVCCDARSTEGLLAALEEESLRLDAAPPDGIETTLLVHPFVLTDFVDYNDFLDVAEAALDRLGLAGVLQLASFHPEYRFADAPADDISHATNRSPFPMLHLIRESSIDRAVRAFPRAESIFEANIATMRRLGLQGWEELRDACRRDAEAAGGGPGGKG